LSQELLTLAGAVFADNLPARLSSLLPIAMTGISHNQFLTMQLAAGSTSGHAELHFSARS
jgi:hypothetical protein